ncbi:hypothetical protein JM946_17390 [Steroidobacter sp. S1-65]|uniref:Restriction endonuclease n=1 Tax=Steroidobacter gossypii TaxID=2805490 RepID=A0ABS1WZV9_9GAMM|nr:hypothetical protein [Steroidobacter gossypii]MBM0106506.1 hypothetical protein [Steroidobacter gossypii]
MFELLASTTWRTILRAKQNQIALGEDAITSINLNAIASFAGGVAVEDTRIDEAKKGCDFEVWIGSADEGWCRYAVQAKKISFRGFRYEKLRHRVRGRDQIEILQEYAAKVRAAPIFCFFNFAPHVDVFNCKRDHDETQLGCMVLPAAVVEDALRTRGRRHFGWLHAQQEAIPWRCLITCLPGHLAVRTPSASLGWQNLESFHHEELPHDLQRGLRQKGSIHADQPVSHGEVPSYPLQEGFFYPRWHVVVDTGEAGEDSRARSSQSLWHRG